MSVAVKPKKKSIPKVVKDLAWNTWIGEDVARAKCMCCGVNEIKMNSFHCGHVTAEVNGGKTTVDNLRPICAACNLSMGTVNLNDFKMQCGFSARPSAPSAPVKGAADIRKEKIEKLLASSRRMYKRCPGTELRYGIGYSILGTNPCKDSELHLYNKHCNSCGNHYTCGIYAKGVQCPCLEL
jgi:hypothetical protein